MSLAAHAQAVLDHLRSFDVLIGDNRPPSGAPGWQGPPGQSEFVPYAIMFFPLGGNDLVSWSLDGTFDEYRPQVFIRCFGGAATQARELLDVCDLHLADQSLQVPGRRLFRLIPGTTITMSPDDDVEVRMHEAGRYYRVWTVPA